MKWILIMSAILMSACATTKQINSTQNEKATTVTQTPPAPAMAPKTQATPIAIKNEMGGNKISCSKGSETRVLEIEKKDQGCSLAYTKAGKTTSIASSTKNEKHCVASQKKIRTKLENAGYKCS
jgi:hypothetical protein